MNSDSLAIGLDRLRFYAKDAVLTLTQVSDEGCQKTTWLTMNQCICKP